MTSRSSRKSSRPIGASAPPRHRPILRAIFWLCLSCLPVLAVGGWVVLSASSSIERVSLSQAQAKAEAAVDALNQLLLERRGNLMLLADMSAIKGLDPATVSPVLDRLVTAEPPAYRLALVADAQGQILAVNQVDSAGRPIASGPLIGQTVAQESWFQEALRAVKPVAVEGFQADPLMNAVFGDGPPVLKMSVPIKDDLGIVTGVLSVRLALKPLHDVLTRYGRPDQNGTVFSLVLLNKDGQRIAGPVELPQAGQSSRATVPATGFLAASGLNWRLVAYGTEGESPADSRTVLAGFAGALLIAGWGAIWAVRRYGLDLGNAAAQGGLNGAADAQPRQDAALEEAGSSGSAVAPLQRELQIIFDSVPVMIWCKDTENRIVRVNQSAAASIGRTVDEIQGRPTKEFFPDDADRYYQDDLEVIRTGHAKTGMIEPCHKASGEHRWVQTDKLPYRDEQGTIVGVLVLSVDITDRVQAEEAERQRAEAGADGSEEAVRPLQKLEVAGRLAGGIAHDFGNLLTIILGHSELLREGLGPQAPLLQPVDEIAKAAERASVLARYLLAFSRQQPRHLQRLSLNDVVTGQTPILEALVGDRIRLVTTLAPAIGPVLADRSQIEHILLHLCANARDAMPAGGTLTIETGDVVLDQAFVQRHIRSKPGAYIMLAVTDTGVGMDDFVQAHCFDPYFTTKPTGEATGLGLSTVYGIVKQNEGVIDIVSAPDQGTAVKIYLPRVEASAAAAGPAAEPAPGALPRGTETILLVEDELGLRMMLRRVLRQLGYTVLDAPSAAVALGLATSHAGTIHLLVTDVVMPEMSGTQLACHLNASRPEMKVLYMSGYPDDTIPQEGVVGPPTVSLRKPFAPEQLARTVREILEPLEDAPASEGRPDGPAGQHRDADALS